MKWTKDNPLRVVVAEDHPLSLEGLLSALESIAYIKVVGVARDGSEALAITQAERPDLLLSDVSMSGLTGVELAETIRREIPSVKFVAISAYKRYEDVHRIIKAGASGYILKEEATSEQLETAIQHAINCGYPYVSESLAREMMLKRFELDSVIEQSESLSPRQKEIVVLVSNGLSPENIVTVLDISHNTVKNHLKHIRENLDLHTQAAIVAWGAKNRAFIE